MSTHPKYEISTLRDIFRLPSADAMERCLKELTQIMVSARAMEELLAAAARLEAEKDGVKLPDGQLFAWPEVTTWTDDGGLAGSAVSFINPADKTPLVTVKYNGKDGS